jgi:hypothetical protein
VEGYFPAYTKAAYRLIDILQEFAKSEAYGSDVESLPVEHEWGRGGQQRTNYRVLLNNTPVVLVELYTFWGTYSDDSMDYDEGMKVIVRSLSAGYRDVVERCRSFISVSGGTIVDIK